MFTLLIAAIIGAYTSQRVSFVRDGEIASVSVDYQRVWQDLIALLTFIGAACTWVINAGRSARHYVDQALLPWLNDRGLALHLPTIDLPTMPASLVD